MWCRLQARNGQAAELCACLGLGLAGTQLRADQVGEWIAQIGVAELAQAVVSEHWGVWKGLAPRALQLVREGAAIALVLIALASSLRVMWLS